MAMLQGALAAAGNYSYFNLLAIVLCIPLVDDAALQFLVPKWKLPKLEPRPPMQPAWAVRSGWVFTGVVVLIGVLAFFRNAEYPRPIQAPLDILAPFSTVNAYGAFAVMTKSRPEIILEGSRDGVEWQPWEFKYKPGRVDVRPGFIAPWQPRLDWQMWFAALGTYRQSPWLGRLVESYEAIVGRVEGAQVTVISRSDRFLFMPSLIWVPFGLRERAAADHRRSARPDRRRCSRRRGSRWRSGWA